MQKISKILKRAEDIERLAVTVDTQKLLYPTGHATERVEKGNVVTEGGKHVFSGA